MQGSRVGDQVQSGEIGQPEKLPANFGTEYLLLRLQFPVNRKSRCEFSKRHSAPCTEPHLFQCVD